jgi:hypothetical protein
MFGKEKIITIEFPRIARERLQVLDFDGAPGPATGKEERPSEEEQLWYDILKSTAPEMEKLKKKLSVCAIADVVEYSRDEITITYDTVNYTIKKPTNSLRIARAREYSIMAALEEMNNQRCITVNGTTIPKDFTGIDAEVIKLLASVCEPFFFMPYL